MDFSELFKYFNEKCSIVWRKSANIFKNKLNQLISRTENVFVSLKFGHLTLVRKREIILHIRLEINLVRNSMIYLLYFASVEIGQTGLNVIR